MSLAQHGQATTTQALPLGSRGGVYPRRTRNRAQEPSPPTGVFQNSVFRNRRLRPARWSREGTRRGLERRGRVLRGIRMFPARPVRPVSLSLAVADRARNVARPAGPFQGAARAPPAGAGHHAQAGGRHSAVAEGRRRGGAGPRGRGPGGRRAAREGEPGLRHALVRV